MRGKDFPSEMWRWGIEAVNEVYDEYWRHLDLGCRKNRSLKEVTEEREKHMMLLEIYWKGEGRNDLQNNGHTNQMRKKVLPAFLSVWESLLRNKELQIVGVGTDLYYSIGIELMHILLLDMSNMLKFCAVSHLSLDRHVTRCWYSKQVGGPLLNAWKAGFLGVLFPFQKKGGNKDCCYGGHLFFSGITSSELHWLIWNKGLSIYWSDWQNCDLPVFYSLFVLWNVLVRPKYHKGTRYVQM